MHLGQFLSSELKNRGISISEVARLVNKTDTGVRKDLEKESLHQTVIEAYSKLLGLNLYKILAADYEGYPTESVEKNPPAVNDQETRQIQSSYQTDSKNIEVLSVNISVPADKQEALLKLLLG